MFELIALLIVGLPLIVAAILPALFGVAVLMKVWYRIRETNMKKFADEYGLQFEAHTPGFKQCIYQVSWPYALKEDWKTNFIEGTFKGHKIFICDNLFSGPRVFGKPLNQDVRRTVVQIDGKDVKGKELQTQFWKFQDGGLTSVWELKKNFKNI